VEGWQVDVHCQTDPGELGSKDKKKNSSKKRKQKQQNQISLLLLAAVQCTVPTKNSLRHLAYSKGRKLCSFYSC